MFPDTSNFMCAVDGDGQVFTDCTMAANKLSGEMTPLCNKYY